MYDCLEYELVNRPVVAPSISVQRFQLHLHWRDRARLQLKLAPRTAPHRLSLAYAAALSMGIAAQNLPDGSLLLLDLTLNEALIFQARFTDLLAHYEPARHNGSAHCERLGTHATD
jgi:hypothetical protein